MDGYRIVMEITELLTWLGFFTAIVLSLRYYLDFLHKQRIAFLEKGIDVVPKINIQLRFPWLTIGLIILSIGLALLIWFIADNALSDEYMKGDKSYFFMFSSMMIFGGIAIIIGRKIERSLTRRNG